MMKAVAHEEYGGPEVLKIQEMPKPTPGKGEVLVKVYCVALNPIDWKQIEGIMKDVPGEVKQRPAPGKPATVGHDIAGVVEAVGEGCTYFSVGDAIYGFPALYAGASSLAEYVAVPEKHLAPKSTEVTDNEAAGLAMVAQTMFQALYITGVGLLPNQKVLVLGGSGGTGTMALQIAKLAGAHVITTCSKSSEEFVKGLGADEIVDYCTENVYEKLAGAPVSVVVDTVGEKGAWESSQGILEEYGAFVSIAPGGGVPTNAHDSVGTKRYFDILVESRREDLLWTNCQVRKGLLKPVIDKVFKFEEVVEAFTYLKAGRAKGKVIVEMQ